MKSAERKCDHCGHRGIGVCRDDAQAARCRHLAHPSTIHVQRQLVRALATLRRIKKRDGTPAPTVRDVSETLRAITGKTT